MATSERSKVLIITYYWPPSGGPGVQRCVKFVRYLPLYGIEPVVVTINPKKASYPLLDKSLENEIDETVKVHRTNSFEPLNLYTSLFPGAELPRPGFANESNPSIFKKITRFIRGNFFIPDARIGWNRFALAKARKLLKEQSFVTILSSSPPHSTQLIAMQLSKEFNIPWIADLRDPWTDIYYNHNLFRGKRAKQKDAFYEKKVLEKATVILTVSQAIKTLFLSKSTFIEANKIHVIPNGFDRSDFPRKFEIDSGTFTITYTGTMSDEYPVLAFIRAVQMLLAKNPGCCFRINLVGQVTESILKQFQQSGLLSFTNVLGYLSHSEALKAMFESSVVLLIIPDVAHNEGILTGKLFEYLASRRPILAFGPLQGDAAKIIASCDSGKFFSYDDSDDAGIWLQKIYNQFNTAGELISGNENIELYSRQAQSKQLAEIISNLTKK